MKRVNYQEKGSGQASRRRWYLCWNSNKGREGALWCQERASQVERTESAHGLGGAEQWGWERTSQRQREEGAVTARVPELEAWGPVRVGGEGRGSLQRRKEKPRGCLSRAALEASGQRWSWGRGPDVEGSKTGAQEAWRGRAGGGGVSYAGRQSELQGRAGSGWP